MYVGHPVFPLSLNQNSSDNKEVHATENSGQRRIDLNGKSEDSFKKCIIS